MYWHRHWLARPACVWSWYVPPGGPTRYTPARRPWPWSWTVPCARWIHHSEGTSSPSFAWLKVPCQVKNDCRVIWEQWNVTERTCSLQILALSQHKLMGSSEDFILTGMHLKKTGIQPQSAVGHFKHYIKVVFIFRKLLLTESHCTGIFSSEQKMAHVRSFRNICS